MKKELLQEFLPEVLGLNFEVKSYDQLGEIKTHKMEFHIHLDEHNDLPSGYLKSAYESKGFLPVTKVQVETREDTISNISSYYNVKPSKLRRQYKKCSSNFNNWDQKSHAEDYMLFAENLGPYLSIDEVSLSKGELYTFITNKSGKGKKKTLVASIKGTLSKDITNVLDKLPLQDEKE